MKKILVICLLSSLILLTGCWDSREINDIGFATAVGVDKAEDSHFVVTIQIANPKPIAATKEKTTAAEPFWVISSEGKTIFEAIRELSQISSKRIVWSHNYLIIVGESLARYNIAPVIDIFTHNPELRMKTPIVVAKGKAKDYIGSKAGMEDVGGASLAEMLKYSTLTAENIKGTMLELSQEYFSEYKQPVLSVIGFEKEKLKPSDSKSEEEIETIKIGGSAVFKKGKMVAMLSPEETKGFSWVMNNTNHTLVTVIESKENKTYVSVETQQVKSKINTKIKNGIPCIEIKISGKGSIVEEDDTSDLSIDEFKKKIEDSVNAKIVEDIQTSVDIVQKKLQVDAFSLAHIIHGQNNKEWESTIRENWEDIYPNMPVHISADIKIHSSTLNQIPAEEPKKDGGLR